MTDMHFVSGVSFRTNSSIVMFIFWIYVCIAFSSMHHGWMIGWFGVRVNMDIALKCVRICACDNISVKLSSSFSVVCFFGWLAVKTESKHK